MDPTCTGKNLREDVHTGVHIEDVSEHIVESPQEALEVVLLNEILLYSCISFQASTSSQAEI